MDPHKDPEIAQLEKRIEELERQVAELQSMLRFSPTRRPDDPTPPARPPGIWCSTSVTRSPAFPAQSADSSQT
ncbi:ABC transporter C-terminal domain-containing protein [Williamsia sterculiae]|uniref:Transposase n=1 Tax=Williamsia sterculiae TaxID=1344003 RepID=A0A1N7CNH3_9NOCA|nr:ABC transporter C-terminal domain-containing protein [Williamsia sterculiae]SIR65017.1 hypothetical protein SAMN05445060_0246 [Williamsia sterculiae]